MSVKAYLIRDGGQDFLCTLSDDGAFQKLPISALGIARLASECSARIWDEVRGNNDAAPDA